MTQVEIPINKRSDITRFVLEKITTYREINATTSLKSAKKFDKILLNNIPNDLDTLPLFQVGIKGINFERIYLFKQEERRFLIKKMELVKKSIPPEKDLAKKMRVEINNFHLVEQYFQEYLPHTVFLKRLIDIGNGKKKYEYLVLQDICSGDQFRVSCRDNFFHGCPFPRIDGSVKSQLQDIMDRTALMLKETGKTIDFDFFIEYVENGYPRITIFDTTNLYGVDSPIFDKQIEAIQQRMERLVETYNLTMPELLIKTGEQITYPSIPKPKPK